MGTGPPDVEGLSQTAPRFEARGEVGRGADGVVYRAQDRDLRRTVAIKRLAPHAVLDPDRRAAFLGEARLTGALQHPGVPPIYELGADGAGEPFFAMPCLEGDTLAQRLGELRDHVAETRRTFGRFQRLATFVRLCQVVAYAHRRGVAHRDIKPSNVLLGEFGEVFLLDWGIAVHLDEAGVEAPSLDGAHGTPGFLAPERLLGQTVRGDLADVFGLGVVLYELLTLRRPFPGRSVEEILLRTVSERPPPPSRVPGAEPLSEGLEELCLRALARDPARRLGSAAALAEGVEAFLDRERQRARRSEEADRAVAEGNRRLSQSRQLEDALDEVSHRARTLRDATPSWARLDDKRKVWAQEDAEAEAAGALDAEFARCERSFLSALERVPAHRGARRSLVELWMRRASVEEGRGDGRAAAVARQQALNWDDGRLAEELEAPGTVTLRCDAPDAVVWHQHLKEVDRLLMPAGGEDLGIAPLIDIELPAGSSLLVVDSLEHAPVRLPILLQPGERLELDVVLPTAERVPPGGVWVAGGPWLAVGPDGRRHRRTSRGFAIAAFPVTFGDYLDFLARLAARDPEEAARRLPRSRQDHLFVRLEGATPVLIPEALPGDLDAAAARRLPVVGVDWDDAIAWCREQGRILGCPVTLPTEQQWEKAARGADGRRFPWGDAWDPSFVNGPGARPGPPMLGPVGAFGMDESIYGARDLCGGVLEWCRGWFDQDLGLRPLRGHHWARLARSGLSAREGRPASERTATVGFRWVCSAEPRP